LSRFFRCYYSTNKPSTTENDRGVRPYAVNRLINLFDSSRGQRANHKLVYKLATARDQCERSLADFAWRSEQAVNKGLTPGYWSVR
ncbi:MAG: hypothetical protein Q8O06_12315, partial [Acetobacterium sp.]|nr:hypothetical protein [Acetobacterium sp.]